MTVSAPDRALMRRVLLAYAAARTITGLMWLIAVDQLRGVRMIAGGPFRLWRPALLRCGRDAYYDSIARAGYPPQLPLDGSGAVLPNAWAFLPAFLYGAARWRALRTSRSKLRR